MAHQSVHVRQELVSLATYEPLPPDKHPMFLENRVYQGSQGKVYPLPFFNRIADKPIDRAWQGIWLENQFIEVLILPEIGGRIHVGRDKTNGYDFFYRQNVIKPALVGLAGPWISGGVEFNWPQHHRPATYMPVEFEIEDHPDGSKTVWLSDHDPMSRMKGMHGVCLHPDKATIELKVRAYNRTPLVQTFLWWANVGARVHEGYQSFFPPDVTHVADHAKRAVTSYPLCDGSYYGVDYASRAKYGLRPEEIPAHFIPPHCAESASATELPAYAPNDLSWYANIPVPTSYMCIGSQKDFFGGYDHTRRAGLVHVANHHISPGKKQWTWGNHEFGYAWDRNLTDADGPYIELMAGVFTDNQPDFSFLQPGETKTWSQYWYPIRDIGPVQAATTEAALSLHSEKGAVQVGVCVTEAFAKARLELSIAGSLIESWTGDLSPERTLSWSAKLPEKSKHQALRLALTAEDGREIVAYEPAEPKAGTLPVPATEPQAPVEITSTDELFFIGLHLEQYRHATRSPELYWREALRRDPGDSRCNNALGLWHFKRGEFSEAEVYFRRAIARLIERNPNPGDGESYYNLGLTLRYLNRDNEAYSAFYKSIWNQAWQSAGYHALAEIDCCRRSWTAALDHLDRSLRMNTDDLRARNLRAIVLLKMGRKAEAERQLDSTLKIDPLDAWARHLSGRQIACDSQTLFDLAIDFARAGLFSEAVHLLENTDVNLSPGSAPLISYYLGWLHEQAGHATEALRKFNDAKACSPDYCFPARLEEIAILQTAIRRNPDDARAPYYLGNLFYDKKRHAEAIRLWEKSAKLDPGFAIVWRNIGIGYFNISQKPSKARSAYEKAFAAQPGESRLLYERDQLWKRLGLSPRRRLIEMENHRVLVNERDDLSVEICALYNQTGQPERALEIVSTRKFQPWEGGEGLALGQHVRTHRALSRIAFNAGDLATAKVHLQTALCSPHHLGEARHLLANQSDIHFELGKVCSALHDEVEARAHWKMAAEFRGDFQEMSVRRFSEMTYYSALSLKSLGKLAAAGKLLKHLLEFAKEMEKKKATIDYFATSLPTMLLFNDDIQFRQETAALFLKAQAHDRFGKAPARPKHCSQTF